MMAEGRRLREPSVPPAAFVRQVKSALEHLYDLPFLQRLPLAQEGGGAVGDVTGTDAQELRREIIAAIETMGPGAGVPFRTPHARLYNLLHLRYVEGMTVQEAAREVGVSLRQAYRDLRRGEESVAAMLWAWRSKSRPQELRANQVSSVQAEMARLETRSQLADVRLLLRHAQEAVGRMASQRSVDFHVEMPSDPVIVPTDPLVARQVLVNLLSHAVQQARPGDLWLVLAVDEGQSSLTLRYSLEPGAADLSVVNGVVAQLVDRLRWVVEQEDQPDGSRTVALSIAVRGPTVLVIDDNEGLVELLDRYLTGHACRVIAATGGREGLRLAQEALPDAIVLDVMMPEMDGWELLQRLRTSPQTAAIPVVICSVFNDPELAYSLGASIFLPKPVSRDDVLAALRRLSMV